MNTFCINTFGINSFGYQQFVYKHFLYEHFLYEYSTIITLVSLKIKETVDAEGWCTQAVVIEGD